MQLSQKYKMPTIVARKNEQNFIRGSARGLNDSELKDFRSFLLGSGLFQYAQGHANAFGISISNKNYDRILDYANQHLKDIDFGENSYDVNFERRASANDLEDIITDIGSANGIWGQFNSEPIIHITKLFVNPEDINIMGKTQDTVKIESNGIAYMKFRATEFIEELRSHVGAMELEIVGRANLNEWGGRIKPQIFIDDYEIKDFKAPSVTDF